MAGMNHILSLRGLPPMPSAFAQVLALLLDPDSAWDQIERALRQDQALTAGVLRLANSARYGVPGKQFDLRIALSRLGRDTLRRCVLQQQIGSIVSGDNAAFGLQSGAMWRSSLGGAIAAEELARRHTPSDASLAFVCGLLRDIGKLAINVAYGGTYFDTVSRHLIKGGSFIQAEQAALGFDHAQVGAALARQWKLPERIARVIEFHHAPPQDTPEHDDLIDFVHAADAICRWAGLGVGVDGMDYPLAEHVRARLHLDRRSAEMDVAFVWEKLREAEQGQAQSARQGAAA